MKILSEEVQSARLSFTHLANMDARRHKAVGNAILNDDFPVPVEVWFQLHRCDPCQLSFFVKGDFQLDGRLSGMLYFLAEKAFDRVDGKTWAWLVLKIGAGDAIGSRLLEMQIIELLNAHRRPLRR
jgi:hypothetical protein